MNEKRVYIDCLAFQIGLARRKITEFYEAKLQPFNLTPTYVYVLGILKDDGPSSLTHIAEVLHLERATVSTLLGRMERDGFIIRSQGNERRTMRVELTPKGIEVMDQALETLVQADKELNENLGGHLEEVKELIMKINFRI
jgi:DNA-binding MarR family transcriptional regulator